MVALPKSAAISGWGTGNDEQTVTETVRLVREELPVDDRRIALAGHSAGGAWAYLEAYASSTYSAVFTLSAPFYAVSALADSSYKPPIRMYYGTTDPNYTGARPSLEAQWGRLGVPLEEDVEAGFSHNTWPASSMSDGFRFLVAKSRPDAGGRLLHADARRSLCLQQRALPRRGRLGRQRLVRSRADRAGRLGGFGALLVLRARQLGADGQGARRLRA